MVLPVIRIETAPGGAVHLATEAGDRPIIRRTDNKGYRAIHVVCATEEEVADLHRLAVEVLPRRGAEPALF